MAKDPSKKIDKQIKKAGLPTGGAMPFYPQLDKNKKGEPIIRKAPGSTGLMAIGSSGSWEIAIDQTVSGPDRWFAQVEGPSVYLYFEIPSLEIVTQAIELLGFRRETGKNAAHAARNGTLALGTSGSTQVKLVRDDEFPDRYFLVIEPKDGLCIRFTLANDDLTHVIDALRQAKEDLE